jgi:hypothetical protein
MNYLILAIAWILFIIFVLALFSLSDEPLKYHFSDDMTGKDEF